MDIKLEVWAKQLFGRYKAESHLVTEGIFRYVAIDDHGRPIRVPEVPKVATRWVMDFPVCSQISLAVPL